jgi:hypothetical protein
MEDGGEMQPVIDAAPAEAATTNSNMEMNVPLPEPVAQQHAQMAAAAQTAIPPQQAPKPQLPVLNISDEVLPKVMEMIWRTLYHHIFTKCGWQQNPTTGRFFFANAAAILEGVNIQHILSQMGAEGLVLNYDTFNADGIKITEQCQGMIRGYLTSKQALPAYKIYINVKGSLRERTFVPQNPEKRGANNAYTPSAEQAGGGHMIAWAFKGEANQAAPFNKKCACKIVDNVYEVF